VSDELICEIVNCDNHATHHFGSWNGKKNTTAVTCTDHYPKGRHLLEAKFGYRLKRVRMVWFADSGENYVIEDHVEESCLYCYDSGWLDDGRGASDDDMSVPMERCYYCGVEHW